MVSAPGVSSETKEEKTREGSTREDSFQLVANVNQKTFIILGWETNYFSCLLQKHQKEEMGEVLHEVDFNQLQIENQQYLEKIDEKNQDLLRLKLMSTNVQQILNTYKKKLNTLTLESSRLKTEISQRNELLFKIDAETQMVEKERTKAETLNSRLKQQLTDYKVPDVLDYVTERADLYELIKTVRMWERKVEIAQMALKTNQKTWRKLQMVPQEQNP